MRVGQISVNQPNNNCITNRKITNYYSNKPQACKSIQNSGVDFKGKFGAWIGGIVGGSAVVATALLAAPAAICLLGGGAFFGAIGGDAAEETVNGKKKGSCFD